MTGFDSKRDAAADKVQESTLQNQLIKAKADWRKADAAWDKADANFDKALSDWGKADRNWDKAFAKIDQIQKLIKREINFCERCGKRTKDIHTCTPPQ
jgi:hypothetical protein